MAGITAGADGVGRVPTALQARIDQLETEAASGALYRRQMMGVWHIISATVEQMWTRSVMLGDFNLDDRCEHCRRIIDLLEAVKGMIEHESFSAGDSRNN